MPLTQFTNLDFDQIKTQIKDYLRSNSNFTDFDFEGSNMSVLIDTLAYNSYITSYNSNMLANEVFIDSATLRENVAALARNVGYTPRSKKSASAKVSFFVDTSAYSTQPLTLTLKAGVVAVSNTFNSENGYSDLEISQKRAALEDRMLTETITQNDARIQEAGFEEPYRWFQCFNFTSWITFK